MTRPPLSNNLATPYPPSPSSPAGHHVSKSIAMVAGYELIKGIGAFVFAGMVALWHDQIAQLINGLIASLHTWLGDWLYNPIEALHRLVELAQGNWIKAVLLIIGYALLRFIEAYGLYKDKAWAYWLSLLGYALFVPLELYYLIVKPFDWLHLAVFLLNLVIIYIVYRNMQQKGMLFNR